MLFLSCRIDKTLKEGCKRLARSQRRLEDIYNIVFSFEGVFSRTFGGGRVTQLSYSKAKEKIETLSRAINKTLGKDNFVGLYGRNSADWLILFWAILKSGNKPYLINLRQPENQISSVLSTLSVTHIIYTDSLPDFGEKKISIEELLNAEAENDSYAPFGDEVAITTSGTTLSEKICIYTGREFSAQILNSREAVARNPRIKKGQGGEIRMLMLLPLYHIFGLEASYLWFLFTGAVFVFSQDLGVKALLETARTQKVTHIFSVPLLWHNIESLLNAELLKKPRFIRKYFGLLLKISFSLQNLFPRLGLLFPKFFLYPLRRRILGTGVRFCISGGSYLKDSAMRLVCSLGYPLFSGYGSTEIGIASVDFSKRPAQREQACAGKCFSSVEFEIRANGRLFVKGESVCKKQIIDGKYTPCEGWFDTGDIAFKSKNGKYYIVGRDTDVVISDNGENLNPDLAEQAFSFSFIKNFTVLGDEKNEHLILVAETEKELSPEGAELLKKELKEGEERLPRSYRIQGVYLTSHRLLADGEIKISRTRLRNAIKDKKFPLFEFYTNPVAEK